MMSIKREAAAVDPGEQEEAGDGRAGVGHSKAGPRGFALRPRRGGKPSGAPIEIGCGRAFGHPTVAKAADASRYIEYGQGRFNGFDHLAGVELGQAAKDGGETGGRESNQGLDAGIDVFDEERADLAGGRKKREPFERLVEPAVGVPGGEVDEVAAEKRGAVGEADELVVVLAVDALDERGGDLFGPFSRDGVVGQFGIDFEVEGEPADHADGAVFGDGFGDSAAERAGKFSGGDLVEAAG
jgi:hypothetical protein